MDIVLGFLSSGGGKANQPLGEYVHHTLKMKRRAFIDKVARIYRDLLLDTQLLQCITQYYLLDGPNDTIMDCILK